MKPPAGKRNRKRRKKGATAGTGAATAPGGDGGKSMDGKEAAAAEGGFGGAGDEERVPNWLVDAFSSIALEQVRSAYREAQGDPLKAADILGTSSEGSITSESSSSREAPAAEKRVGESRKQKKVVASTGLVSNVIGREYGAYAHGKVGRRKTGSCRRDPWSEHYTIEEAEEFLCSTVGGSCELDPAVVKDVFGHCCYDVEKTLDVLLDMSASSSNRCRESNYDIYGKLNHTMTFPEEFSGHVKDHFPKLKAIIETSHSQDHACLQVHKSPQIVGYNPRAYSKAYVCSDDHHTSEAEGGKLDLQQMVLDSMFNLPNPSKQEPSRMNWKEALKKVESFSQGMDFNFSGITEQLQNLTNGKEDDNYVVFQSAAAQHWDTMKSYYQRAAMAYSKGERAHATYLSGQGKLHGKLAREADEKASREIFEARNKDIRNEVTIDLHGQHVKQAVKLLKLHLLLFSYIPSIQFLRVITGCGTHGVGRGKLKQSVIGLVQKEGIRWSEDNPGTLILRIDGLREYSFMTPDSDSEQVNSDQSV